jgi:hypothetical protein
MIGRVAMRFWVTLAVLAGVMAYALILDAESPRASEYTWENASSGPARIVVAFRNDDLTVLSRASLEDSVIRLFAARGIRQLFAFIPDPGNYVETASPRQETDPTMVDSLRSWHAAGLVEFALHGYSHLRHAGSSGEFDGVPSGEQLVSISRGKRIADSVLGSNVNYFAPPWNQADQHTLEACRAAGIRRFSGYVSAPPVDGVIQVNTNSVLFAQGTGLPEPEELLPELRKTRGTAFLVVFYHSRVDFPDARSFQRLENLLSALAADTMVEFRSFHQIVEEGGAPLAAYTSAGLTLGEAEYAMDRAKPYVSIMRSINRLSGDTLALDTEYARAVLSYRRGEYGRAAAASREAAGKADALRVIGRLVWTGLVVFCGFVIYRRVRWLRRFWWQVVGVLVTIAALGSLWVFPIASAIRVHELTVLVILAWAAQVVVLQWYERPRRTAGGVLSR